MAQPLRQFMLRRVAFLVTATAALFLVGVVIFGLVPQAERTAHDEFEHAARDVRAQLDALFAPSMGLLPMGKGWMAGVVPDLASPVSFNQFFKPLLKSSPEITSVVAGTSSGQGWLLLEQPDGAWRNRMTDVPRWGTQRHLIFDEGTDGTVTQSWSNQTYDPRVRPWFAGALTLKAAEDVHWTPPYIFFTTAEPGITASIRQRLKDGRDFVLGFDLKLRDLSRVTEQMTVGKHGMALVLTDDEHLLALPPRPANVGPAAWNKLILQPASALGIAVVSDALTSWRASKRQIAQVLAFDSGATPWLLTAHPYELGKQKLWVVVLAPSADFPLMTRPMVLTLVASWLGILLFALWLTKVTTVSLSRPLEVLADNGRRIGVLDFGLVPAVHSSVAEIAQLSKSQQMMLETLRDNQRELNNRADELSCQISTLQATEARLQQKSDMLQTIIDNFPGGVSVVNADLRMVAFNQPFQTLLELPDALLQRPNLLFEDVIRYNAQRGDYGAGDIEAQVADRVRIAREFLPHRMERTLPNGTVIDVRGTPLPGGGMVTLYIDITATKRHEHELEHLAHFDPLTGLPNRVLLSDRLRQGMVQVGRRGDQLAVAYLDLDGFKVVNDTFGHEMGDQLLVGVSARMRQVLREGDTLARLGGDEFVAVFTDVGGLAECVPMLDRLLVAANAPQTFFGTEIHVSASIGVAMYGPGSEVDADQLLRQADQAMYQAKQLGKNCYQVFDAAQDLNLRGQVQGIKRVEQALQDGEFVLYYQPKVNMRSGEVVGLEALIRWQHPQQGLMPPGMFLPLIEGDPITIKVGEWVIRTALAQMAAWLASGLRLQISVNVGARQLQHDGFVTFLRAALQQQPEVSAEDLQIEVLETSALQDMARVTDVMTQCRSLGFHFALDDFGTGYSSLTYLRRLPVSDLKIDQSFVRDMLEDPDDLSILVGVLDLAASFKLRAVAEGVETLEHGHMLLQLGCALAQGYGIARPMPGGEVAAWVANWRPDPAWERVCVLQRSDLPIVFAQVEHRAWVNRVQSYLQHGGGEPPPLDVHQCHLGKWLDAGGLIRYASAGQSSHVHELHQQLHALAAQLCLYKLQGDNTAVALDVQRLTQLHQALALQLKELCNPCEA